MILIDLLIVYFISGVMLAVWFSFYKVQKIYGGAKQVSWWFRLIIMPGTILLWPWVLRRIYKMNKLD